MTISDTSPTTGRRIISKSGRKAMRTKAMAAKEPNNPALGIQGNAMGKLKLSGLGAFHAADDSNELSITGEVHDP